MAGKLVRSICKTRWLFSAALLLCSLSNPSTAQVAQVKHTGWSTSDGAPADIWAIDQGADGYLWLGTGDSLYRFDGARFERFVDADGRPLASTNITALKLAPDGDVWLGYYQGGVSRIRDGRVTNYNGADGIPPGWVTSFAVSRSGVVWASFEGGLAKFENEHWEIVGGSWNFTGDAAGWALFDPDGTLWVTGRERIFFLRAGSHCFVATRAKVTYNTAMARSPDGTLWVADYRLGVRALPGLSVAHPDVEFPVSPSAGPAVDGSRLLFDSQGRLWVSDHILGGVFVVDDPRRIAQGSILQEQQISARFNSASGLTSAQATPLFEDREHNVWVGTNFGLDSFRHANVAMLDSISANPRDLFSIAIDPTGVAWVSSGNSLYRWENGRLTSKARFPGLIHDLLADRRGGFWFLTNHAIIHWHEGATASAGLPEGLPRSVGLTAETIDGEGTLWASFELGGVYFLAHGHWTPWNPQVDGTGDATAMAAADTGAVWMGFSDSQLVSFDGRDRHLFSAKDGLHVGNVLSISATDADVLVGGETGIAWNVDGKFKSVESLRDVPLSGVSGIARKGAWIWFNTSKGVIRIAASELREALADGGHTPALTLFGPDDGLTGIALQSEPIATAQIDKDGRIWLETNRGIAVIDPSQIGFNSIPPHVSIRFVETDAGMFDARQQLQLPELTERLRIAYTATSLSVPSRVQFRYLLEGVDKRWRDAGNRREAVYTNLKPGSYRFRLLAANEDGIWSTSGAYLDFVIVPAFYQTKWFLALAVALALLLIAVYARMRIRRYTVQIHMRLAERHAERDRIARDLHDTLLQSVHGLILRVGAATGQVQAGTQARRSLEEALDIAEEVMMEGRDRVSKLRAPGEGISDLAMAIDTAGRQLALIHNFGFSLERRGAGEKLQPLVIDECFAIVREALVNTAKHGAADHVGVVMNFDRKQFSVSVSDDGAGMEPSELATPRGAHFGIMGMKERARNVGGRLSISSACGAGTTVLLVIPARRAYAASCAP